MAPRKVKEPVKRHGFGEREARTFPGSSMVRDLSGLQLAAPVTNLCLSVTK